MIYVRSSDIQGNTIYSVVHLGRSIDNVHFIAFQERAPGATFGTCPSEHVKIMACTLL